MTNDDKFNEIFATFPSDMNFEKEMLVVYIVSNFYMGRSYKLKKLTIADDILTAELKSQPKGFFRHDTSSPKLRCFVIKMEKKEVIETSITVKD